jgi:hypothetical protein
LRHPPALEFEFDQQCRPLAGKIRQVERGADADLAAGDPPATRASQAVLMSTLGAIFQKNVGPR